MNITIIGSGFAGLSTAAVWANKDIVFRFEKHNQIGGQQTILQRVTTLT